MPDDRWNFEVERVNLNGLRIDAGQRLGMVIVQPKYDLVPDATIPFRISEVYRKAQKALIEKAFQIRAGENQERGVPIPFILFPEAAIPVTDPDGLDCLRLQMQQAEGEIVFIGGLEGVSPILKWLIQKRPDDGQPPNCRQRPRTIFSSEIRNLEEGNRITHLKDPIKRQVLK